MPQHNFERSQVIADLIDLSIPGRDTLRIQNYQQADYFYQGNPYAFVGFSGSFGVNRRIGLGSSGGRISIGNEDAKRNSLYPVRDWLFNYDGWRKASIIVTHVWVDEPLSAPIVERRKVFSASIIGAEIKLTLKGQTDTTNARIPNFALTRQRAPELPSTSPSRI